MSSATPSPTIDTPPAVQDFETQTTTHGDYQELDYPDPIDHGMGTMAVWNDLERDDDGTVIGSTYRRLWEAWRERVEDPANEPHVVLEDVHERWNWLHDDYPAHLVLKSKKWMVGSRANEDNTGTEGTRYEYSLQVQRYDPDDDDVDDPADTLNPDLRAPVSCQIWIQPQNEDLVYKSGDSMVCAYGEGTKAKTQTTYATAEESIQRTIQVVSEALEELGKDRPDMRTINRDSWRVWKGEVHHRFKAELMSAVVQKIRSARTLIEHGGDGDVDGSGEYTHGQHIEERVVADTWNRIGFAGYADRDGYQLGLKVYRLGGSPQDARLKNPKLEAFFAGTDGDTNLPHVDEWSALRATLRQMASAMAIRSGIAQYDLRPDDYYQPQERDMIDTICPTGWRKAMREANEERERRILHTTYESLSLAKWDILWTIAVLEGATYDQLQEHTGYSYDYVREIVEDLEQQDVLLRMTYPRVVVYHNEELRLNAIERLQEVEPDRGLAEVHEAAERRRETREERVEENTSEGSETNDADSDEGSSESSADDSDGETWRLFRDVLLNGDELGRALDRGTIEDDHVKLRTDPYPMLGD